MFSSVVLPARAGSIGPSVRYDDTNVRVVITSSADYDGDEVINSNDFFAFLTAFFE